MIRRFRVLDVTQSVPSSVRCRRSSARMSPCRRRSVAPDPLAQIIGGDTARPRIISIDVASLLLVNRGTGGKGFCVAARHSIALVNTADNAAPRSRIWPARSSACHGGCPVLEHVARRDRRRRHVPEHLAQARELPAVILLRPPRFIGTQSTRSDRTGRSSSGCDDACRSGRRTSQRLRIVPSEVHPLHRCNRRRGGCRAGSVHIRCGR